MMLMGECLLTHLSAVQVRSLGLLVLQASVLPLALQPDVVIIVN